MRYFIKAYPMHEEEVRALALEADSGAIEADIADGLVVGTADEAAIRRLASQGIVVQALGAVPEDRATTVTDNDPVKTHSRDAPASGDAPRTLESSPSRPAAAGPEYWLADLLSSVTDESMAILDTAGAEIVERDPTGAYVLRTAQGAVALRTLPFVQNLRPYGAIKTLSGEVFSGAPPLEDPVVLHRTGPLRTLSVETAISLAGADPVFSSGRFEAICHEPGDLDAVAEAIGNLGGSVISKAGRAIRFVLNATDIENVAALPGVASVAAARSPQLRCDVARTLVGVEQAGPPPRLLPFDGRGETVGVADTGIDQGHPDFATKQIVAVALGRPGDTSDPDGHGTHVAGTIVGDGTASRPAEASSSAPAPLRGIAPAANLYFQSLLDGNGGLGGLPDSLATLLQPAYDAGVRIHNNSWGAYIQSRYDSMALDIDEFVHSHPDFLPVIAAGNEGSCRPGLAASPGFVDYPSLGSPATAKNGITVGASRSSRTSGGLAAMTWKQAWPEDFQALPIADETVSGNPEGLAAFSSRGPVDDFRIKPDLVAPGTDIAATRSSIAPLSKFWGAYPRNRFYAFMGGTSMACPIVAGCAVLTRQFYRSERAVPEPSAALIKATLINGTAPLTGADALAPPNGRPNYHQGFGRIDLARSIPDPADPAFELFFIDTWKRDPAFRFANRKGRVRWEFVVKHACALRIAVVWTDYPGRGVQNQLRVILDTRRGGKTVNWVGNAEAPVFVKFPAHDPTALLPGQDNVLTRDPQNNVQIIRADVEPGSHILALFADGLVRLPQDFALVATFPVGAVQVQLA